jgi:hypothetical protein
LWQHSTDSTRLLSQAASIRPKTVQVESGIPFLVVF